MKKFIKILALFCFFPVIISGCAKNHTLKPKHRVVTQVDIVTRHENVLIRRHYNTPEKMRPVLLYLRLLHPQGQIDESGKKPDGIYLISLQLSDGHRRYYRQASHRYFSSGAGPWKNIDPAQAYQLYAIMRYLPSDL